MTTGGNQMGVSTIVCHEKYPAEIELWLSNPTVQGALLNVYITYTDGEKRHYRHVLREGEPLAFRNLNQLEATDDTE